MPLLKGAAVIGDFRPDETAMLCGYGNISTFPHKNK
jgi:hypothetical protein